MNQDAKRVFSLHRNNKLLFPHDLFLKGEDFDTFLPFIPANLRTLLVIPSNSSCAVIGNSRNLLNSNLGTIIDSHDIVIRINTAPTESYELDVGRKTSVRFKNQYRTALIPSERLSAIVTYSYNSDWDRAWLKYTLKPFIDSPYIQTISLIHPFFLEHINQIMPKPSTGLIAIITAIHLCKNVDIFGFGINKKDEWDYYFDSRLTSKSSNYHFAKREGNILKALEKIGLIKIYHGNYRRKKVDIQ